MYLFSLFIPACKEKKESTETNIPRFDKVSGVWLQGFCNKWGYICYKM